MQSQISCIESTHTHFTTEVIRRNISDHKPQYRIYALEPCVFVNLMHLNIEAFMEIDSYYH